MSQGFKSNRGDSQMLSLFSSACGETWEAPELWPSHLAFGDWCPGPPHSTHLLLLQWRGAKLPLNPSQAISQWAMLVCAAPGEKHMSSREPHGTFLLQVRHKFSPWTPPLTAGQHPLQNASCSLDFYQASKLTDWYAIRNPNCQAEVTAQQLRHTMKE